MYLATALPLPPLLRCWIVTHLGPQGSSADKVIGKRSVIRPKIVQNVSAFWHFSLKARHRTKSALGSIDVVHLGRRFRGLFQGFDRLSLRLRALMALSVFVSHGHHPNGPPLGPLVPGACGLG